MIAFFHVETIGFSLELFAIDDKKFVVVGYLNFVLICCKNGKCEKKGHSDGHAVNYFFHASPPLFSVLGYNAKLSRSREAAIGFSDLIGSFHFRALSMLSEQYMITPTQKAAPR
jgi:hypothetical protein